MGIIADPSTFEMITVVINLINWLSDLVEKIPLLASYISKKFLEKLCLVIFSLLFINNDLIDTKIIDDIKKEKAFIIATNQSFYLKFQVTKYQISVHLSHKWRK